MLFRVDGSKLVKFAEAPIGQWSQGIAFSRDGKTILVQNMVEKDIQVFRLDGTSSGDRSAHQAQGRRRGDPDGEVLEKIGRHGRFADLSTLGRSGGDVASRNQGAPMRFVTTLLAAAVVAGFAARAQADCKPVIDAYAKAEATRRYALYDVAGIQAAPKGKPFHVDIDGVGYTDFGGGHYKNAGNGQAGSEGDALKRNEQKGTTRCEPLGERQIGGEAAVGYQIRSNDKGAAPDVTAIHLWIAKSTGLPIFHGMGSDSGGLRWVYGPAVVAPAMPESTGSSGTGAALQPFRRAAQRHAVARRSQADDHALGDVAQVGVVPERLAPVDVADVHLDERDRHAAQGIAQRDAGVRRAPALTTMKATPSHGRHGRGRSARPRGCSGTPPARSRARPPRHGTSPRRRRASPCRRCRARDCRAGRGWGR